MDIQVNEVDYCKLEVLYKADPDIVADKREEALIFFRNQVGEKGLSGFRKGKVPDSAIKLAKSKEISTYVAEQMKAQAYDDAVFETDAKPIGYPGFEDVSISGNNFSCKMTLLKKPDFELKDFRYEVPKPHIEKDAETEVQESLHDLRMRCGDVEPYGDDDFVDIGDQVTISFEATIDGKPFEGSSSEGQLYVVGQNSLEQFDDSVLGMAAGETRKFQIKFPDNYPEIGGKTADFEVTLIMGTKRVPCELNDDFAKQCGEESVDTLKDKLFSLAKSKIKQSEIIKLRQQIAARLVEDNEFRIPDLLKDLEAQHIAAQHGIDYSSLEDSEKEVFQTQADKQVRLSMILDSVRDKEPESVLSDSEAQNGLVKQAQMKGKDPKEFIVEAQKNGTLFGMLAGLKDEFTMQWLVDQATIVE